MSVNVAKAEKNIWMAHAEKKVLLLKYNKMLKAERMGNQHGNLFTFVSEDLQRL